MSAIYFLIYFQLKIPCASESRSGTGKCTYLLVFSARVFQGSIGSPFGLSSSCESGQTNLYLGLSRVFVDRCISSWERVEGENVCGWCMYACVCGAWHVWPCVYVSVCVHTHTQAYVHRRWRRGGPSGRAGAGGTYKLSMSPLTLSRQVLLLATSP